jgi:hypothetical protein
MNLFYFLCQVHSSQCYPLELDSLNGRKLLLKVEKTNNHGCNLDERPFKVERICSDLSLIDAFDSVIFFYYSYNIYIWHYLICSIFINFNSFFQPFLNDATDSEDDEWRSSWADRLWIALGWKISSLLKKNIGSRDVNVIMENTISFDFMVRS